MFRFLVFAELGSWLQMLLYEYIDTYIYICICIYVYIYMYICIYVYIDICIYVYLYIYICVYVYITCITLFIYGAPRYKLAYNVQHPCVNQRSAL